MKTAWLCFVLIACGHKDSAPPPPPAPAPAACGDADESVIAARKKQYARDAIVSFHKKLEDLHVEPLKVDHTETKDVDPAQAVGALVTRPEGRYIAGPIYKTTDELPPEDLDIIVDSDRRVYVVERQPQITLDHYVACHCVWQSCPKPGTPENRRVLYGPLPADVQVMGSKAIAYDEKRLAPDYRDRSNVCACGSGAGSGSGSPAGTP